MAHHTGIQAFKGLSEAATRTGVGSLVALLRANVFFDRVSSGDRLPSIRQLAKQLSISPTTALGLYNKLEDAGFVESHERSGTFLRRVGVEENRDRRDSTLLAIVIRTVARLRLLGISPEEFSRTLLRYVGATSRTDFRFGVLTTQEAFDMIVEQAHTRTKTQLHFVRLNPDPACEQNVRAQLARDPSIRCLLASYLYAERATRLADELGLSMSVLRMGGAMIPVYQPPPSGHRYIITRDLEFAAAIRRLVCLLHGPEAGAQFCSAGIDEIDLLVQMEREASEIHVSPLCWDRVVARFGTTKKLLPLPTAISQQTIDDMLFQYIFAPKRRPRMAHLTA